MTEEEIRNLVTEEVGKAKTEIMTELGGKLDEIKAKLPDPEPADPADPEPEPPAEPDPEPEPEPANPEPPAEPSVDEKLDDISNRLKGLEAGASKAATGQDDPPEEKKEKWGGVLENVLQPRPH